MSHPEVAVASEFPTDFETDRHGAPRGSSGALRGFDYASTSPIERTLKRMEHAGDTAAAALSRSGSKLYRSTSKARKDAGERVTEALSRSGSRLSRSGSQLGELARRASKRLGGGSEKSEETRRSADVDADAAALAAASAAVAAGVAERAAAAKEEAMVAAGEQRYAQLGAPGSPLTIANPSEPSTPVATVGFGAAVNAYTPTGRPSSSGSDHDGDTAMAPAEKSNICRSASTRSR